MEAIHSKPLSDWEMATDWLLHEKVTRMSAKVRRKLSQVILLFESHNGSEVLFCVVMKGVPIRNIDQPHFLLTSIDIKPP